MAEPLVGILVGSESDRERMQDAFDLLDKEGVGYEFDVRSAHRTPDAVAEYARSARELRNLISLHERDHGVEYCQTRNGRKPRTHNAARDRRNRADMRSQ